MHAVRITRRAACAAALAACLPLGARSEAVNQTATPDRPATLPLPANRPPNAPLIDLYVRSYTPPRRGSVEAVVSVGPTGTELEIGRFAVFPAERFEATSPRAQRAFRFDAAAAFAAAQNRPLIVQVRLEATDAAIRPDGASLTLGRVVVSPRPAQ